MFWPTWNRLNFQEESLAYIEEYWEYTKNVNSSLVGTGNLQLYAPQVFYVIPIERILCKAEIMRDPVTPTIPAGILPTMRLRGSKFTHMRRKMGLSVLAANCTFTIIGPAVCGRH